MPQNDAEQPKPAANLRWFIWGVATLIAINFLIFWRLVVSPGSSGSPSNIQPAPAVQKTNPVISGSKRP